MTTLVLLGVFLLLILLPFAQAHSAPPASGETAGLHQFPAHPVETRWFTLENRDGTKGGGGKAGHGRKGSAATTLQGGERLTIAQITGPGVIRRIWMTVDKRGTDVLRGVRVEIFWDGASTPAVQAPLGDFFCHAMGQMQRFENAFFSSPEGRSFHCAIPMPFRTEARIELLNETQQELMLFYEVDCTLGDRFDENSLYFHAYWRRENPTQLRRDMAILPRVEGRGRFLGCHLGMRQNPAFTRFWWGEGEVKVYLDGDDLYPTLCGTGTEDYIGTAWGQDLFVHQYQGCHFKSGGTNGELAEAYGFYRFHVPDPIWFGQDIRVDIQIIGGGDPVNLPIAQEEAPGQRFMQAGDGTEDWTPAAIEAAKGVPYVLVERQDDYCAAAYWYMDRPENGLPPLAPAEMRTESLPQP